MNNMIWIKAISSQKEKLWQMEYEYTEQKYNWVGTWLGVYYNDYDYCCAVLLRKKFNVTRSHNENEQWFFLLIRAKNKIYVKWAHEYDVVIHKFVFFLSVIHIKIQMFTLSKLI